MLEQALLPPYLTGRPACLLYARAACSALQGPGYLCCHHPPQPPPDTLFWWKKNQDKHLRSSGSNGSTQAFPLDCPWVLMPYHFMGLAVLMLQCLLASLREGKNNQRKRGNAPMTTLVENDTHIQDSLQVVCYIPSSNVHYNPAIQSRCRCSIATEESFGRGKSDHPPLASPGQSVVLSNEAVDRRRRKS